MGKLSQRAHYSQLSHRRTLDRGAVGDRPIAPRRELRIVLERIDVVTLGRERDRSVSVPQLRVVLERLDPVAVVDDDGDSVPSSDTISSTPRRRRRRAITSAGVRAAGASRRVSSQGTAVISPASPRSSLVDVPSVRSPVLPPPVVRPPVVEPPRRRHAAIPHRVTYRLGIDSSVVLLEELCVTPFTCGPFDQVCQRCGALFFVGERGIGQTCCHGGRVTLPPLRVPDEFRSLYTSQGAETTRFLANIRVANSLFAMASFKTSTPARRAEGQGQWSFSVCGQIYHFTMGVPSSQDLANPMLSHFYFLDVDEVLERRGGRVEGRVSSEVLRRLEVALREHNRYVRAYVTMGEVLQEERRRRQGHVRDVTIGFCRAGDMREKSRQHNLPDSRNEIAAVFYGTEPPFPVDLVLYPRGEDEDATLRRHELKNMNPMADPLVYPLLFPCGEDGWSVGLRGGDVGQNRITLREFYRYRLQCREGRFSLLHNGGKLFQQYIVDAWVRVEGDILWWYRQNQDKFRFVARQVLARIAADDPDGVGRVGRAVVLPPAFQSGPRHIQRQYLDAMTVVARHGKPDLFITFTCNPSWSEIVENLAYRQRAENRPDLVCRVFKTKLLEFLDDIVRKQVYSVVLNYHYVIELQKRGLPHAHIVVTFVADDVTITAEQVDGIVCAAIPDAGTHPRLLELVGKRQVHRPCGADNPDAPCMVDGRCKKGFPKAFAERTVLGAGGDSRPVYKRPEDGRTIVAESAKECVTTHLPKLLALKMDGAEASCLYSAVSGMCGRARESSRTAAMKP